MQTLQLAGFRSLFVDHSCLDKPITVLSGFFLHDVGGQRTAAGGSGPSKDGSPVDGKRTLPGSDRVGSGALLQLVACGVRMKSTPNDGQRQLVTDVSRQTRSDNAGSVST